MQDRREPPVAAAPRLIAACLALIFSCCLASAHHKSAARQAPTDAISIPNLMHGQMTVIAANRRSILDLAERMPRADPTLRRLVAYINLQFSVCMWGRVPDSITDKDSPFNECTHAYLAGTKALLMHLKTTPDLHNEVRALVAKVDTEMAADASSLVMCRYSDEPFNTSERISPRWNEVFFHLPSVLTFAGSSLMSIGSLWLLLHLTRPPSRTLPLETAG